MPFFRCSGNFVSKPTIKHIEKATRKRGFFYGPERAGSDRILSVLSALTYSKAYDIILTNNDLYPREDEIMPTLSRKLICAALSALLIIGALPLHSLAAEEEWAPQVISGTYSYTTNEGEINQQGADVFVYRDRCFMRSSYLGCEHLMTLSAQVAISSASRWGDEVDPECTDDPSANAQNVADMLYGMGFSDVETNKYYTLEKQENSAAAALAHRTIQADGKTYTLLAIIPRSANYKQEWVGNFTVGDGEFHDGFKQGRDEILRFVKQYITSHGITGDLKVWIAGHSRGAALANSLGGFFAGGGASYFDNVSVTPDNVYCYTFATPLTVTQTVSKKAYLSVSGPREDPVYANDTQTDGYVYPEDGILDPHDPVFDCVRNYPIPYDLITKLPPSTWGYTCFGSVESYDLNGGVTVGEMLDQLKVFAPFAYEEFADGGDFRAFCAKTFDFALLEIVDDPSAEKEMSMDRFIEERMLGLVSMAPASGDYVDGGYEETLKAVAGLYGMLHGFKDLDTESVTDLLVEPLLLSYIAYGRDQLKAEGRLAVDATDPEAACAVLCDLLSYITESEITGETTTDDAICATLAYIAKNEGSPLYDAVIARFSDSLPTEGFAADLLNSLLAMFVSDPNASKEDKFGALLKACVYGPEEGTPAYDNGATAETVRALLYTALGASDPDLGNAIGYGYSPASSLTSYILSLLLVKETDADGNPAAYYSSIDEGADEKLANVLKEILTPLVEKHTGKYGEQFDAQLKNHFETLLSGKNVSNFREMIMSMLMYSKDEPFSAKTAIGNAATFVGCASMIPLAHYNEVSVAWCKAIENKLSVAAPKPNTMTADGRDQQLVVPAEAKEGLTVLYALGNDGVTAPSDTEFNESIPTASESGTYYVWYRAVGDLGAGEPDCVDVTVPEPENTPTVPPTGSSDPLVFAVLMIIGAAAVIILLRNKEFI